MTKNLKGLFDIREVATKEQLDNIIAKAQKFEVLKEKAKLN